jgi:uroporphyrin-III C-methyltransferase/precorrin-2 dehydrogenase/sirohydrochlorin ferrochelatase
MGTIKAEEISCELIAPGRAADTPVAVISQGTQATQSVRTGTLQQLAALAADAPTPALMVIGEVVKLRDELQWFQKD